MNPREYYHIKTASITEADVRLLDEDRQNVAHLAFVHSNALELNRQEARVMQTGLF